MIMPRRISTGREKSFARWMTKDEIVRIRPSRTVRYNKTGCPRDCDACDVSWNLLISLL